MNHPALHNRYSTGPLFSNREGIIPFISMLSKSPAQIPSQGFIFEDQEARDRVLAEENTVVERPVWQAFVVMLMSHFPEMGVEIAPALDIGTLPPSRITLSEDGRNFLNMFILKWYEGGVEVTTLEVWDEGKCDMVPTQDVQYLVPYRPVTGLNLIVTPTVQRSMDPRETVILREKEKFGHDVGLNGIGRYLRLCVWNDLIPKKSHNRGRDGKSGVKRQGRQERGGRQPRSWLFT